MEPSPASIRVHGLLPGRLAASPSLTELRGELAGALAGRFLLTWAAGVETSFLSRTFGGTRRRWLARTIDVRELSKTLVHLGPDAGPDSVSTTASAGGRGADPRSRVGSLEATAVRFGIPVERAHHAFDDALMTAELFLVMATRLAPHGFGTVRSFLRRTRKPRRW